MIEIVAENRTQRRSINPPQDPYPPKKPGDVPRMSPHDHKFRCLHFDASPRDGILEVEGYAENRTGRVVREAVRARVRG